VAYRDDREALLARNASLETDLARERLKSIQARAEAKKLRRQVGVLSSALGRGAVVQGPTAARVLPLIVASLVAGATLIGVNVGRVRAPSCPLGASAGALDLHTKIVPNVKPAERPAQTRLVPAGMGLVTFDALPAAGVSLDGHLLGQTPLDSVLLPAGQHIFQFQVPGRTPVLRRVLVPEGQSVSVQTTVTPAR